MNFRLPILLLVLGITLSRSALAGGTITWPTPPLPPDANPAATSTAPIQGWLNYFEQSMQKAKKMGHVDLIFDGNNLAITSGHYGPTGGMWQRFNRINAIDFANPDDTTQAILWRLQNGQLDNLHPLLAVLMLGGSNIGPNTPEQIAGGVKAVVAEYQKRCPDITILLLGVMPRGEKPTDPMRDKVKAVNALISAFGDGKKVIYLDFGDKLLEPDGTITKAVLGDFVHPGPKGYQIWADAIQPTIDQFFPPASLPPAPKVVAATSPAVSASPTPAEPEPIIGGGTVTWPPPPLAPGENSAVIPTPAMGWLPHLQKNIDDSRKMPKVDLIFDGDSITAGWMGGAGGLWNKHYAKLNAFDFGISGDSTSGLLWRVENGGQVDGLHPKLVVLLIGTNNMYANSAEQIAGGIQADIAAYRKHLPDTTVLVQGILPRGEQPTDGLRAKVKAVNKIVSTFADGKNVIFIDWGDKMLTPEGLYTKPMTGDFLHPQLPGYQIWIDSIQPVIDQFFPPDGASAASPSPAGH